MDAWKCNDLDMHPNSFGVGVSLPINWYFARCPTHHLRMSKVSPGFRVVELGFLWDLGGQIIVGTGDGIGA